MSSKLENKLFDDYFSKFYGDRWPALNKALVVSERQILRRNLFSVLALNQAEKVVVQIDNMFIQPEACSFLKNCFWKPENFKLEKNMDNLYPFYVMDPASVVVALALEAKKGEQVLDLCAAPGGKTLVIAEGMQDGVLVSNEYSDSRRERLNRVLHEYIPKEKRMFIHTKGLDGNQYGLRQPNTFDRVLADVPCSGERHLLENPKEFLEWSVKRTKNLAVRQYSLLSSAWLTVKPQGRIVYSTCSISPEENDQVIAKLLKKRKPQILRPPWLDQFDFLEKTEYGYQILPDRSGFGPMYFSVIEKV